MNSNRFAFTTIMMMAMLFSNAIAQCNTALELQDLRDCPMLEIEASDDLAIQLHLQTMVYEGIDGFSMRTRAFAAGNLDPTIPGPVIRVKAGSTLHINYINDLGAQDESSAINGFFSPNTTNLHLHGLHISGELPGDDVSVKVEPGEERLYTYDIPSYHSPGTHYYHPHKHGAVAIQVGGGAAGMMIVDDDDSSPQGFLQDLPEVLLVLQSMTPATTNLQAVSAADEVFEILTGTPTPFAMVNGLRNPLIVVNGGQWYRFRMMHSSSESQMSTVTLEGCDMILLAKDGMYLSEPRSVSFLRFLQPSRVDVAVRCPVDGGSIEMLYEEQGETAALATVMVGTTDLTGPTDIDIENWDWTPPTYLTDMRGLADNEIAQTLTIEMSVHGRDINGQTYTGTQYSDAIHYMQPNTVEEWYVDITEHPLHVHVNPIQLQTSEDEWNQSGDFVDTFLGSPINVRSYISEFTGKIVLHCHLASHSDAGLMGIFWVGDESDGNQSLTTDLSSATRHSSLISLLVGLTAAVLLHFAQ